MYNKKDMTKRFLNFMLFVTLIVTLGLTATSCKDDDDNENGNSEQEQAVDAELANKFWTTAGQLVGIDQATNDYLDKTFEPTIGTPKDGNATIREVLTNDAATAAMRFCDLAGLEDGTVDSTTATYTWQDDAVGTLTYTKTQDGSSLATVDVAIRQIPGLRQIVYLTAAQQGKNGFFPGTAYYRFGDLISRPNVDGKREYWLCVRPCFGPENKSVSHWITVSPLPNKNIYTYKGSNGIEYQLPTNIGINEEHMQNLAEMLWAISYPDDWQKWVSIYWSWGFRIFHDFSGNTVTYYTKEFWEKVQTAWKNKDICQTVFGYDFANFSYRLQKVGILFLVKGYSWPWGNSPSLYQYHYSSFNDYYTNNMHKKVYTKVSKNVIKSNINLNLKAYTEKTPYLINSDFFGGNNPRFIIRHATGKELTGAEVDVYKSMAGTNGIEDIYTYNGYYNITPGKDTKLEEWPVKIIGLDDESIF